MHSNSNVRWSRWSWNADSVHSCHWIVSSVTLSVFQLYLEQLTYFLNVSSVTWNASSVIWNASNVSPGIDPGYSSSSPDIKYFWKILRTANSSVKYEISSSVPGRPDDPSQVLCWPILSVSHDWCDVWGLGLCLLGDKCQPQGERQGGVLYITKSDHICTSAVSRHMRIFLYSARWPCTGRMKWASRMSSVKGRHKLPYDRSFLSQHHEQANWVGGLQITGLKKIWTFFATPSCSLSLTCRGK
jgi:hypothetical protein